VFGALVVVVGLLLLLNNMHIIHMRDVWQYWPAILIVIGLSRIAECHTPSSLLWGGLIATVGALLLLDNLNILVFDFNYVWPLVVIVFGLTLLWRALERRRFRDGLMAPDGDTGRALESNVSIWSIFGGGKRRVDSQDFQGGDALAIFGGVQMDLRQAAMKGSEAVIDLNAMFGGVEILVPNTWAVTMRGMPIFGGFEDKTLPPRADQPTPPPRLVLTGVIVFGGVTVSN
jgi:predicted membrane protein